MPSLYVHVPFCIQKCDYCAFYSHALEDTPRDLVSLYLEGLKVEISNRQKDAPLGVSSLFIGGGTPTALKDTELELLLKSLKESFLISSEAEMTVEGNPGTLSIQKLRILRHYGINRFSLGVQSFADHLLRAVGRIHTAGQVREAISSLRNVGFDNLNLDLMFGLPGQTMSVWQASVDEALTYSPEHLSLYGLMLEEGTPLFTRYLESKWRANLIQLPDDDLQAQMYEWAAARLKQAGYLQYETSNFALPGFECRHNLGYWQGQDYMGLGPGGVSCLRNVRWRNIEDVTSYAKLLLSDQSPVDEDGLEVLSLRELMAERMILGLRLQTGVSLRAFKDDFGADLRDIYRSVLERYCNDEVLVFEGEYLRLNPRFAFVANSVLREFV